MPGQKTKFSEVWLSAKDSNGDNVSDWCKKKERMTTMVTVTSAEQT